MNAPVPGSIYSALTDAGYPHPYWGKNMIESNKYSSQNWYYAKTFNYQGSTGKVRLNFEGICNVADVYLNGTKVASHEGMFGGPYVDVTGVIRTGENLLVVHLKPAKHYSQTIVFNCSYGWHYANLWPLGIWESVSIESLPTVGIDSPFVATKDHEKGTIDLSIELDNVGAASLSGTLAGVIAPKNFVGESYGFTQTVSQGAVSGTTIRLQCDVPNAKLWWPNGYGEQNLYTLTLNFTASDGSRDTKSVDFGIRTLSYAPFPCDENPGVYNRTIVINGQPVFMRGAGWCTIDAMMHFSLAEYDRILSRAHAAGINFLRAWGGGLVETDEFYDLCDKYGICVYQEWPMCWNSHTTQPIDVLEETIILGAKRLRNRPSLIVWGGGNEGQVTFEDPILNHFGRLTYETDGTRAFWRQDGGVGGGGITHDHVHWSGNRPEHYLTTYANVKYLNLTEYGVNSMMNIDSIRKYASAEDIAAWPIPNDGVIAYHTSTFNGTTGWNPSPHGYDIDTLTFYADAFLKVDNLENLILGSQLAQAQGSYLPAQNSRMNFPDNTITCVYKMNDVYPGASWSIVDWYGAPKIAYYLMQDAFRPLMAAGKFDRYNTVNALGENVAFNMPVYILDDADALASGQSWKVLVSAYDNGFNLVKQEACEGVGSVDRVKSVGEFRLSAEQKASVPLMITVDLILDGAFFNRSYTYMNYELSQGSLFTLPRTNLTWTVDGNKVTVKKHGSVPVDFHTFHGDGYGNFCVRG